MAVAADDGWRVLQLAELLRALEHHEDQALRILDPVEPGMRPSFALTFKSAQVAKLQRAGRQLVQLAEQIETVLDALPDEEAVTVDYEGARASAEHLLRLGDTLDARAVLLAARLLDRTTGLPALAEGLRSSGAYTAWSTTTIGSLLGGFRGVTPQLVRRIATAARLAPGTEIAGCHPDQIAALAEQVDVHARG
ncbi:MAG TPA: hypothetical protein VFU94_05420 [Conexibacter sp.]|nr:hypothetical protein [Conexibacter sp.]